MSNLTLPTWTDSVYPDRLRPFLEWEYAMRTYTKFMKLVRGGPLVSKIVHQMSRFQSGDSSRPVYIYSGHDLTLLSVIRLLNLSNETSILPEYGATLAFELHNGVEGGGGNQLEIRVSLYYIITDMNAQIIFCKSSIQQIMYYFNFNDKEPKQLTIPHCPAPCMLDQFVETIKFYLDFDYANACILDKASRSLNYSKNNRAPKNIANGAH